MVKVINIETIRVESIQVKSIKVRAIKVEIITSRRSEVDIVKNYVKSFTICWNLYGIVMG